MSEVPTPKIDEFQALAMNANTMAPLLQKRAWHQRFMDVFRSKWEAEEFVSICNMTTRYTNGHSVEWKGSLYRQKNRKTGVYRYYVKGDGCLTSIDGPAFERNRAFVFI